MVLNVRVAPEVAPVKVSPFVNEPETFATSRTLVSPFQDLTLAVVPLEEPVTVSLNTKFPVFVPPVGASIEIVGATEYPTPVFVK